MINEFINDSLTVETLPILNLFISAIAVLAIWLIRKAILSFVVSRSEDPQIIYNWRKGTDYVALALGLLILGSIWFEGGSRSLATYLGLLSAGIAIALQDLIINLVGWLFIIIRRPFELGDRIQIADYAGDVIDIRFFQFSLLEINGWVDADQSTGRLLHVPNRFVFSYVVASYSKGISYIWNEIPVEVTFESDWQLTKKLMLKLATKHDLSPTEEMQKHIRQAARRYPISYANLSPTVYTKVNPSGVLLTLRYLCEPRKRRDTEQSIWEDVLEMVAGQPNIDFAYPTQRIYYHPIEGKTLDVEPHVQVEPRPHRGTGGF